MESFMTRRQSVGLGSLARWTAALVAAGVAGWMAPPHVTLAQQPSTELQVMPVRGNVFMIVGAGSNVTVSTGVDGMLLVDTGSAVMAPKTLEKVLELGRMATAPAPMTTCVGPSCYPPGSLGPFLPFGWAGPSYNAVIASPKPGKPIRWIVQTSADPDHTGGTPVLAAAGTTYNGGEAGRLVGERTPATVIGHENVLKRMTLAKFPEQAWPSETYYIPTYKMSQYINGEGIQMHNAPAAITDADTIVYFRFSDVISAGDLFTPGRYPKIDVDQGGSVQGLLDGLNKIIDLAFPEYRHQGGTMIVGGHGRIGDTADVAIYRNMVEIIRDRIRDMKKRGLSIQQVKADRPTLDFDGISGSPDGFIDAVYRTLQ
jgi:glyoxylase-like metal-dependent hydrolase (beta-lactamase superfamily II)